VDGARAPLGWKPDQSTEDVMTEQRMEILLRCLQRAFEQGTRTWSSTQRSLSDWTFNTLERTGVMTPVLEEVRERQQRWIDRVEEQLLEWNHALARRAGTAPDLEEQEDAADQGDPGEEPEDAPELQKPRAARRPRKTSAAPRSGTKAASARKPKTGPRPRSRPKT
jgi:hypothetical protein